MLGIIFTRKRMFAAWSNNGLVKWIPIGVAGKSFVYHSGSYLLTLQNHFNHIFQTVQWHAFGNGMTPLESPSLALVFPGDHSHITPDEKQLLLNWIKSLSITWSSIQMSDLAAVLSSALPRQYAGLLLFEALDGGLQIYSNLPHVQNRIPYAELDGLGKEDGIDHIYHKIIQELNNKNLSISGDSQEELKAEIAEYFANKPLLVNYYDNFSKISIDLTLSPSRYYDLLTHKRDQYLKLLLYFKIFEHTGICIIYVSDLFDNTVFRDYIKSVCKDQFLLNNEIRFFSELQALEKVMNHLDSTHPLPKTLTQSGLLAEIKSKCVDRKKYKAYVDKYTPLAKKINISEEITIWYIRQSIQSLQKLSSIGEIVDRDYKRILPITTPALQEPDKKELKQITIVKKSIEDISSKTASEKETIPIEEPLKESEKEIISSIKPQFDPDIKVLDQNLLRRISDFAVFEEDLATQEFICFKGKLIDEKKRQVFRILKNNASEEAIDQFEKLHEREKSYYKDCSLIFSTTFGDQYYYRPFFEAEKLEVYVKRIGLNKKYRIKEISAVDLELMLELWRIIYRLKFAFAGLTKDSFIVSMHWRLPLKKEIDVKLVNINSSESTKAEMETQLTEIFEEIFGENLTNEFKKQFRNH
ncbi:MAG: hypothetical protein ACOYOA_13215 [Saprospiraceae bacterium]